MFPSIRACARILTPVLLAALPLGEVHPQSAPVKPSDAFAANAVRGVGAEVNPQTGQLGLSLPVVDLPGIADEMDLDLSLSRYDVAPGESTSLSGLPVGWKWDLDRIQGDTLELSGSASLKLDPTYPSGLRFVRSKQLRLWPQAGEMDLVYDGRKYLYRLETLDGGSRYFDRYGKLLAVDDRFGNYVLYQYEGTGDLTRSRLTAMVDRHGRKVVITYREGAPAKEVVVTLPDGRTARCRFDVRPAYGSNITLESPEERVTRILLDPGGAVIGIVWPWGGKTAYAYLDNAINYRTENGRTGSFAAVQSVVEDPVSPGSAPTTTRYAYVGGKYYTGYPAYTFGDDSLMSHSGSGAAFEYTTVATTVRTDGNGPPVRVRSTYNHLNIPVKTEVEQGGSVKEVTTPVYVGQDAMGRFPPVGQLDQNYGRVKETRVQVAGRKINAETASYDADGLVAKLSQRTGSVVADTWVDYFDRFGLEKRRETRDSGDKAGAIVSTSERDPDGLYVKETTTARDADKVKVVAERDDHGRMTRTIREKSTGSRTSSTSEGRVYKEDVKGNRLTTVTRDALANESAVTVDIRNGFVLSETDAAGATTTYDYLVERKGLTEPRGLLVKKTHPDGSTELEDRRDPRKTVLTSSSGRVVTDHLDGFGRIVRRTDNGGARRAERTLLGRTYDELGQVASETDRFGRETHHFHADWQGRRTSSVDSLENVSDIAYDDAELTETTSVNGVRVAKTQFDDDGEPIRSIDFLQGKPGSPLRTVREIARNGKGQVTLERTLLAPDLGVPASPLVSRTLAYDVDGNETSTGVKTLDGGTRSIERTFDVLDEPLGAKVEYASVPPGVDGALRTFRSEVREFDAAGNLVKLTDPLGRAMSFTYDKNGRLASRTDVAGRKVAYERDVMGRVMSAKFEGGTTIASQYHPPGSPGEGRLRSREVLTQGKLVDRLEIEYDDEARGLPVRVKHQDGKTIRAEYDAFDRLTALIDGNGNRSTVAYDPEVPENVVERKSPYGSVRYAYHSDRDGPLFGSRAIPKEVSYFDADGRVRVKIAYDYHANAAGAPPSLLLERITATGASGALLVALEYGYDEKGRVARIARRSGSGSDRKASFVQSFTYNDDDQLIREETRDAGGDLLETLAYTYDIRGNILSRTSAGARGTETTSYTFDDDNKLTASQGPDGSRMTYEYDPVGALRSVSVDGAKVKEFQYDELGQLIGYKDRSGADVSYAYDAVGLRRSKTDNRTGYSISYQRDVRGEVLSEEDSRGVRATRLSGLLRTVDGKSQWILQDMKDVVGFTDDKATSPVELYRYDAFGGEQEPDARPGGGSWTLGFLKRLVKVGAATGVIPAPVGAVAGRVLDGGKEQAAPSFSILGNPSRYAGYAYDEESGMYNLKSRLYAPEMMRFLSRDLYPSGNRYAYADGDPVGRIDPGGTVATATVLGVVALVSGLTSGSVGYAAKKFTENHPSNETVQHRLRVVAASFGGVATVAGVGWGALKIKDWWVARRSAAAAMLHEPAGSLLTEGSVVRAPSRRSSIQLQGSESRRNGPGMNVERQQSQVLQRQQSQELQRRNGPGVQEDLRLSNASANSSRTQMEFNQGRIYGDRSSFDTAGNDSIFNQGQIDAMGETHWKGSQDTAIGRRAVGGGNPVQVRSRANELEAVLGQEQVHHVDGVPMNLGARLR